MMKGDTLLWQIPARQVVLIWCEERHWSVKGERFEIFVINAVLAIVEVTDRQFELALLE